MVGDAKEYCDLSDGTGLAGSIDLAEAPTNVYKLYRACRVGSDSKVEQIEQVLLRCNVPSDREARRTDRQRLAFAS
jgi:hypothetical protein